MVYFNSPFSPRRRLPQLPSHLSLWLFCEWIWLKFQPDHLVHWHHVLAGAGHWPQKGNQADDRGPESQDWRWQRLNPELPSNLPAADTLVHAFCFYSSLAHWFMGGGGGWEGVESMWLGDFSFVSKSRYNFQWKKCVSQCNDDLTLGLGHVI